MLNIKNNKIINIINFFKKRKLAIKDPNKYFKEKEKAYFNQLSNFLESFATDDKLQNEILDIVKDNNIYDFGTLREKTAHIDNSYMLICSLCNDFSTNSYYLLCSKDAKAKIFAFYDKLVELFKANIRLRLELSNKHMDIKEINDEVISDFHEFYGSIFRMGGYNPKSLYYFLCHRLDYLECILDSAMIKKEIIEMFKIKELYIFCKACSSNKEEQNNLTIDEIEKALRWIFQEDIGGYNLMISNFKAHFEDKTLAKDTLSYEPIPIKKVFHKLTFENMVEISKKLSN